MSEDAEHSLLSASDSNRHGPGGCPAALAFTRDAVKESSWYADEGSAAHTLASWVLTARIENGRSDKGLAEAYIGRIIKVGEREFEVDDVMAEHVTTYADSARIMANAPGSIQLVEQKVNYATYLGVETKLAWGTSDFVAIVPLPGGGAELQVHDLKYGMGEPVSAIGNSQLRLYMLGALYEYGILDDIQQVRGVIHQPRKKFQDEEVLSAAELLTWAETAKSAAQQALALMDVPETELLRQGPGGIYVHFNPSRKACRWCPGAATCPALGQEVKETISATAGAEDFEDLTVKSALVVPEYTNAALGAAMDKTDLAEIWINAVRAEVERRLMRNEPVPSPTGGYHLGVGRMGNREWTNKADAETRLKAARLRHEDMFKYTLISPTQAEKVIGDKPKIWTDLQKLITRKPGKPSVFHAKEKFTPYEPAATAADFEDLTDELGGSGEDPTTPAHPFR